MTILVNDGHNFFRWSHGGGNGVRITNRVLFCEKIFVCDMLLSNGDIIYRLRKFSTKVRLKC